MKLWELLQSLENRDRSGDVVIALEDHKPSDGFAGIGAFDITIAGPTHRNMALVVSLGDFGIDNDILKAAQDNKLDGADIRRMALVDESLRALLPTLLATLELAANGNPISRSVWSNLFDQATGLHNEMVGAS